MHAPGFMHAGNLSNIVLYDGDKVRSHLSTGPQTSTNEAYNDLASEWIRVLDSGPGVLVVKNAFEDHDLLDEVTEAFDVIIEEEVSGGEIRQALKYAVYEILLSLKYEH